MVVIVTASAAVAVADATDLTPTPEDLTGKCNHKLLFNETSN